ncbi:hypothetical protein K438DRAFT_1908313 [Mycena galopus ATCC 62051]|nr:hypothetical protein K438DRAFT_1908313 [Mycena galopus ATCC 62051]
MLLAYILRFRRRSQGLRVVDTFNTFAVNRSTNVKINRITTLEVLYEYPAGYILEYPETSSTGYIGHLFRMDPNEWHDPILNVAYSRGGRMGQTVSTAVVKCDILVDSTGKQVDCSERHTTLCPNSNMDALSIPHAKATREDVRERLRKDREDRLQYVSPSRDIFLKTLAYITSIQKLGCSKPLFEATGNFSNTEAELQEARELYLLQSQRGYRMKEGICEGRVVFDYGDDGDGSYHVEYMEAIFCGDEQEAALIEESAFNLGYGPLTDCSTVANCSQQKAYCPFPHRNNENNLVQPLMTRLHCSSKFRVFAPKEEFRADCPFVLLVTHGAHPHPVPLPTKTPPKIRAQIFDLLEKLAEDLPDITPRRFIRHPIALEAVCPFGTGWAGVVNLKAQQDLNLPKEKYYIRRMIAIDATSSPRHDEDEPSTGDTKDEKIRIIICMTPEASRRLCSVGRYLQSDIAFTRIASFLEFELACMDRDANTSLIFCRVYINRQTAAAHQRVFEEIEAIVQEDTGEGMKWRHLHGTSLDATYGNMVLSWTADQHRGQAKGLGLHLQKLASNMPNKPDLHQPQRNIQDLDPYEHLARVFRICIVHDFRNVKKCAVSEEVRWLMRGLVCLEHDDWEGTLATIREKGGKAGNDWVNDKESSHFIPLDIWNAGDSNSNLIESVHSDVNREGVHCTLLGGLQKAQRFDALKMKTLIVSQVLASKYRYLIGTDIRKLWYYAVVQDRTHIREYLFSSLIFFVPLVANSQHRVLSVEDEKIDRYNEKLLKSLDALAKAEKAVVAKEKQLSEEQRPEKRQKIEGELEKRHRAAERAQKAFEKQHAERNSLKRGSGKVSRMDYTTE